MTSKRKTTASRKSRRMHNPEPKLPSGRYIPCEGVVLDSKGRVKKMKIRENDLNRLKRNNPTKSQYKIVFSHWTPKTADVSGYNAWDYIGGKPDTFDSRKDAQKYLRQNHLGKDVDGVDAVFKVVRAS